MTLKKFAPWKIQAADTFRLAEVSTRFPKDLFAADDAKALTALFDRLNKLQTT